MPEQSNQAPKTVGAYRIVRLIGSGGMGAVYLGTDPKGAQVAVKVLHSHLARDEAFLKRFEREARLGTVLKSKNIVRLIDYGEDRGLRYLVVEYVDGGTLKEELARGQMPTVRVLQIIRDVARALADAHRHGVIHRDIKPENILLASDGTVKVNDFGVAKQAGVTSLTFAGGFVGSLAYASPEHITGQVVEASDVYSLGVTLYHMLTGTTPFHGHAVEILRQHREDPLPEEPLDGQAPSVKALLIRCLAKAPEDRPTPLGLIADIDAALADANVDVTSAGVLATTMFGGAEETQIAPIGATLKRARSLNPATWLGASCFKLTLRNGSPSDMILGITTTTDNPRASVTVAQGLHVPAGGSRRIPVSASGFKRFLFRPNSKDAASRFTVVVTSGDGSPPTMATVAAGGSWLPFGGLALLAVAPLAALLLLAFAQDKGSEEVSGSLVLASPTERLTPSPTPDPPLVTRVSCPVSTAPAAEVQCFAGVNGANTEVTWEIDGVATGHTGTQLVSAFDVAGVHLIAFHACNQGSCSEPVSVQIEVIEVGVATPSPTPTPAPRTAPPTPPGGSPYPRPGHAAGSRTGGRLRRDRKRHEWPVPA